MKRILAILPLLLVVACTSPRLESGGAYAPLDPQGNATAAPDLQFYQVDAAYRLAYQGVDMVFTFEKANRDLLWKISPQIKKSLDSIRDQAWDANVAYLKARDAYKANPTPAGLNGLNLFLGRMQQLSTAAQALIPTITAVTR